MATDRVAHLHAEEGDDPGGHTEDDRIPCCIDPPVEVVPADVDVAVDGHVTDAEECADAGDAADGHHHLTHGPTVQEPFLA